MPRRLALFCALGLIFLVLGAGTGLAGDSPVYVHYFAAPLRLPDNRSAGAQLSRLRKQLVELAGGYTEQGRGLGGWKNEKGRLETQAVLTFLVSADRDLSAEIAALLARDFKEREPYVLVWQARRY